MSTANLGVLGTTSTGKAGVQGFAPSNDGLYGYTNNGIGVEGYSPSGYGLYGHTSNGYGSVSVASSGTGAFASSNTGTGLSVLSTSGDGTDTQSNTSAALRATTSSGFGIIASASGGLGVLSKNSNGNGGDFAGSYIGLIGRAPASGGFPLIATDSNGNNLFYVDGAGNVFYHGGLFNFLRVSGGMTATAFSARTAAPTVEDTGTAQLVGGAASVRLDPTFAASIDVRSSYRVFVTPNGDTRGLFVALKTPSGFVVRETQGGRSNAELRLSDRRNGARASRSAHGGNRGRCRSAARLAGGGTRSARATSVAEPSGCPVRIGPASLDRSIACRPRLGSILNRGWQLGAAGARL